MTYKTKTVWPDTIQNMTWFEFWNPGQAAALKAEREQNKEVMYYNQIQDELEAQMSLLLTKSDNDKFILIVVIMAVAIIFLTLAN